MLVWVGIRKVENLAKKETKMANQTIEAKDCMTPNSVAHELADNVMPAKANFRKSKTFVLAIEIGRAHV